MCKGSTADSDSVCEGSNPSPAASSKIPAIVLFSVPSETALWWEFFLSSGGNRFTGFPVEGNAESIDPECPAIPQLIDLAFPTGLLGRVVYHI